MRRSFPRLIATVAEVLLFACVTVILASGKALSMLHFLPRPDISLLLPIILLIWLLYLSRRRPHLWGSPRVVTASSLLTIASVHAAASTLHQTSFHPFFFGLTVAFAAYGKNYYWIAAPLLVIVTRSAGLLLTPNEHLSFVPGNMVLPILGLFASGAIPFAVAHTSRKGPEKPSHGTTESGSPGTRTTAPRTDTDSRMLDLQSAHAGRTASFTLDQLSTIAHQDSKEVEGLLSSVVYFMQRNFDAFSALGFIYDPVRGVLVLNTVSSKSLSAPRDITIPLGKGIVGKAGADKRSFLSGDLSLYGGRLEYYTGSEIVNSVLATPILTDDKELLGVLVVDSKNKRVFTDNHKEIIRRFSFLASALITNARMRIEQQKNARHFKVFYETSHKFTTALSTNQVFEILLNTTALMTRYTRIMAITFHAARNKGVVYKCLGSAVDRIGEGLEFPLNAGIYSFAFRKRRQVNVADFQQIRRKYYRFLPGEPACPELRSLLVLPILDDESRCLGLLSIESDRPRQFTTESEQILSTLVGNASVAFTRAVLYREMERLATTDGLTGLNNHRTFQELLAGELERSQRYQRPFSVLLMDIDHFKSFNDTYGHPVGDLVLKEIAACIRRSIRRNDIPARYGGEEFAVILPENNTEGATISAERIRRTIEQHRIHSADRELQVTVSVGCASFPTHATEATSLVSSADKALYYSKEHGRNRVTLFKSSMR